MKMRSALIATAAVGVVATVPPITDGDDGADTRESGTVVVIGPPPPGGGMSISAVGTGCTTRGATTKLPSAHVLVDLDAGSIELPEISAGVTRIVVRNFDDVPHGLVLTQLGSIEDLPLTDDGFVDEDELPHDVFRIAEFPGNTLCEGTFELPAGEYVVFSPSPEDRGDEAAEGTAAGDSTAAADSTVGDSTEDAEGTERRESDVLAGLVAELTITESAPSASSLPGDTGPGTTEASATTGPAASTDPARR